jgi:hypothetical protein
MGKTWVIFLADLIDEHAAELCVVLALATALTVWGLICLG